MLTRIFNLLFVLLFSCKTFALGDDLFKEKMAELNTNLEQMQKKEMDEEKELRIMPPPSTKEQLLQVVADKDKIRDELSAGTISREEADINYLMYREGVAAGGDPYAAFINTHKKYCSARSSVEKNIFKCSDSASKTGLSGFIARGSGSKRPELEYHGDLRIGNLLEPDMYESIEAKDLADLVRKNLISPFNDGTLLKLLFSKNENYKDKELIAKSMASAAALNVGMYSLKSMAEDRAPVVDASGSKATSINKIINTESKRRFSTESWHEEVLKASNESLLRELVEMEAFRLYLDYQKYRQAERTEVVMATLLSQLVLLNGTIEKQLGGQTKSPVSETNFGI